MRLVSLLFILDGDKILLGKKKTRFGAGYWNGFGGGVEEGETIEESACRETEEECGLRVRAEDLRKVAHIRFLFTDAPNNDHDVHVFVTHAHSGEPVESDEMFPAWHAIDSLPLGEMWPSDVRWVPLVLQHNKTIEGECRFFGSQKPFSVESFAYDEVKF